MNSASLNLLTTLCNCERLSLVPENHWPCIVSAGIDAELATIQMHLSPTLHWFKGHFPDQPVLPGVVQTHWACLLAPAVFDLQGEFSALTRLKFKTPLLPGQSLSLELKHNTSRQQIHYRYYENDVIFSTGCVHFGNLAA